jgi:hypothetical protein
MTIDSVSASTCLDLLRKEHVMSTTHDRKKTATPLTDGIGLKKLVAGAFLIGGLCMAVMGLGAGIANAYPDPSTIPLPKPSCPACTHERAFVDLLRPVFRFPRQTEWWDLSKFGTPPANPPT